MADFYVSYHVIDEDYAKWLTGQLEEAGYRTLVGAWDFRAGSNLIVEIQGALRKSARVISLLSPEYLLGALEQAELAAVLGEDPSGKRGRLIPIIVKPCTPTGLLAQLRAIHLENLDEDSARERLLASVAGGRPVRRAPFPTTRLRVERAAFPRNRQWQLQRLPLPLAQLYQRTLNSKSAADRHFNAYYLAEATLKLAAALRLGLWLDVALDPGSELARRFESLLLPEPEHWQVVLGEVDDALAKRQDVALLPVGSYLGHLDDPQSTWVGVEGLIRCLLTEGLLHQDALSPDCDPNPSVPSPSLRTFFRLVLAYREGVLFRAPRGDDFTNQMAERWLAALADVFESPALFGELRLVQAQLRGGGTDFVWRFQDLTGPANLPMENTAVPQREDLQPGALYFGGSGQLVPLAPFCAYTEDDLGRGAVGLLHSIRQRPRKAQGAAAPIAEIVGANYLDYATGLPLRGLDASEALVNLLKRLRNQPATPEDLQQLQQRSAASCRAIPEEVVGADAAIGDYVILGELGRGAMGIVYKARQRSLRRTVALKVLPPSLAADETMGARFRREIAALGRCNHPAVVSILGAGVDRDRAYFAMELIDGADLARLTKRLADWQLSPASGTEGHLIAAVQAAAHPDAQASSLPVGAGRPLVVRLCELFADVALGLAHLHQQGVIHRDIKPGNLMLTRDGQRVVLADLGLARLLDASQVLSQSQSPQLGTLRYMAPELLEGKSADAQSDIYALGVSLCELLLGRPLFDGETEARLRQQILLEPADLGQLRRQLPADLAAVLEVATAKEPSVRYRTAQDFAADLQAVAEQRPIRARPPGLARRVRLYAQRQPTIVLLAVVLALLPLLGTLGYWQWARESNSWYANYIERRGVWEGVGSVSSLRQRHRNATYRFVYQKGRLVRVERRNGLGFLRNSDDGEASWQFVYDADSGRVLKVLTRDHRGILQRQLLYNDDLSRLEYRDPQGRPKPKKGTDVCLVLRDMDERGLITKERYANLHEAPRLDDEGDYGHLVEKTPLGQDRRVQVLRADGSIGLTKEGLAGTLSRFDTDGNALESAHFGIDGKPTLHKYGYALWRRKHDERGNEVEHAFFGIDGKPTLHKDGLALLRSKYDERGNEVETACFGIDGKPTLHKDGFALWRRKYDERGSEVETAFFGIDGKPTLYKEGFALWRRKYDERGNEVERAFFGIDGKPTLHKEGFALWRRKYDERGNGVEAAFFGIDGKPTLHKEGFALWRRKYDEHGNEVETAYFGIDGKPTLLKDGLALWRRKYDERGNEVESAYLGIDGKPTLHKYGFALLRRKYDERRNEVESAYLGIDGTPTLLKDGYALLRRKYDERGNEAETAYFGIDGKPTLHKDGLALWRNKYDGRGNVVESAYFGIEGKPTLHTDGYALLRSKYDERGNEVERAYFGIGGKPTFHKYGYALWRSKYDERGNDVETAYFGINGKPTFHKDGLALLRHKYDERGNDVETAYFGIDGKPTLHKDGHALLRRKYDERGNDVETAYLGIDGKPTLHKYGHALLRRKYDERGNEVERAFFGIDGKLTINKEGHALLRRKYDERGNEVESAYVGIDGKPTLHKNGLALWRHKYDERGNEVERAYFGIDGKPTFHKDGYALWRRKYDERGNEVERAFFGIDGKPTLLKDGYALWRSKYDERGHEVETAYFGIDGKPTLHKDGLALWRRKYDERGIEVERAFFGIDGKPTLLQDGYALWRRKYDERGNEVERACFGIDGKPTLYKEGYALLRSKYDERGNVVELAVFGIDGKPTLHEDGYALWRSKYDERGNEVERAYFGIDGKPTLHKNDYALLRSKYDERGNEVERAYFGIDGQPTLHKNDYALWRSKYDERGNEVERACFGIDGKPTLHKNGYALWRSKYDGRGNEVETAYFGIDGKPTPHKEGYALLRSKYDERGNEVETAYFGIDGKPALTKTGFSRIRVERNILGEAKQQVCLGFDGQPLPPGVLVMSLLPGSQAERLGLKPGDIITIYNQQPVLSVVSLREHIVKNILQTVPFTLVRMGRSINLRAKKGLLGFEGKDARTP